MNVSLLNHYYLGDCTKNGYFLVAAIEIGIDDTYDCDVKIFLV